MAEQKKVKLPPGALSEFELAEDATSFEEKVATEQTALEEVLKKGEDIDVVRQTTDSAIPRQKGWIKPIAFKKENTDMALDALLRLNSKPVGEAVEMKSGGISMNATIDSQGNVILIWKGIVDLRN